MLENSAACKRVKPKNPIKEWIEAGIVALLLVLFMRTFIIEPFRIPSGSMIPTLLIGDRILVNKFLYGIKLPLTDRYLVRFKKPQRSDIVVFKYPLDETKNFIKRVIGIENDRIEFKNDALYINDKKVETKYIQKYVDDPQFDNHKEYLNEITHSILLSKNVRHPDIGPILVPKNHLFVMGDNRDNSADSRVWGFVAEDKLTGKAFMIFWSWPHLKRCLHLVQ